MPMKQTLQLLCGTKPYSINPATKEK